MIFDDFIDFRPFIVFQFKNKDHSSVSGLDQNLSYIHTVFIEVMYMFRGPRDRNE